MNKQRRRCVNMNHDELGGVRARLLPARVHVWHDAGLGPVRLRGGRANARLLRPHAGLSAVRCCGVSRVTVEIALLWRVTVVNKKEIKKEICQTNFISLEKKFARFQTKFGPSPIRRLPGVGPRFIPCVTCPVRSQALPPPQPPAVQRFRRE